MTGTRNSAAEPDAAPRRVLVVDDEQTIAEVVSRYLERAGYETRQVFDGPSATSAAHSWSPDLIVLDIMLPGFDGLEVMRRLDGADSSGMAPRCPPAVILLTARAEEADRIAGLRRGADDYVVKPFSPGELVARADAVLRRATRREQGGDRHPIHVGELVIDPGSRTVEVDGSAVLLTALEFDLLFHLASHPSRVFTRDQLMESVWDAPFFTDTSTVTVHVKRLRGKIEQDPKRPRYIETARGVGYRFRAGTKTPSKAGRA